MDNFNPRAREGRDAKLRQDVAGGMDFNPRVREGRDLDIVSDFFVHAIISIHAPVKGATTDWRCGDVGQSISIHAPVKGAT